MESGLVTYEGVGALSQWREPAEVLAQAKKAAVALKEVIELKPNKVVFNNEVYLEREDWGTVGAFFGCTAKSIETRFVDYGDAGRGFEAVAIVTDGSERVIGRAESMCLDSEETWGEVPKYIWKDKLDENGKKIWNPSLRNGKGGYEATKVQEGTTKKPLFQLRSMAQTRAEAKALKGVFSWVVVLAGYRPTPAEELTGHEDFSGGQGQPQGKPPVSQPTRASEKKEQPQQTQTQPQTQQAQPAKQEGPAELSGVIENAKEGKEGVWWLTIPSGVVMVPADKVDADMKKGYFIKFRGAKKHSDKIGDYHVLTGLVELSEIQEAEVTTEAQEKLNAEVEQVSNELFGPKDGNKVVENMVQNGDLKPASSLPSNEKRPGTIGKKRAQRIYTLCTINKAKNNGLDEKIIKRILAQWEPALEHLSDLPVDDYETFEKWAAGEGDWMTTWADCKE